ncbi:hypothetical protein TGVAND_435770 [Toxoplasma gondii VAND]|uniref:Uncharacterized protein n=1 Tax=Toxoplasma gondii VAND TaxID=933077 RepID=A0A086QG55_TOXGO|nr:hypothetical protein TGVAND_435770 [Toxoplasma gondii VAND]
MLETTAFPFSFASLFNLSPSEFAFAVAVTPLPPTSVEPPTLSKATRKVEACRTSASGHFSPHSRSPNSGHSRRFLGLLLPAPRLAMCVPGMTTPVLQVQTVPCPTTFLQI